MASFNYAPSPLQDTFFVPVTNAPGNGVQLFLYVAGSVSTKQTAWKDSGGITAWSNPIVLDSSGNLPNGGVIWFQSGLTYKAVYAPATDTDPPTSPYRSIDNLSGINDVSATASEWISGPTPTFVSGTQFTMSGDQTGTFKVSGRIRATVTAGTVFGTITSVSFVNPTTTVNVAFASGALDAGLSAVSTSLISVANPSIDADYVNKQASSIASSSTTNIWGVAGNSLHITSTAAMNSFSSAPYAGAIRTLLMDAVTPINFSSITLQTQTGANMTSVVGDLMLAYADNASTRLYTLARPASSFIASMTGCTAPVSSTAFYTLVAPNSVILDLPFLTGGSSTTACSITGIPAAAIPSSSKFISAVTEDASSTSISQISIAGGTGVITLSKGTTPSNTFTSTGTKGLVNGISVCYTLN